MSDAGPDDPDDAAALAGYATALADGVAAHIGPWVERVVAESYERWQPGVPEQVRSEAVAAASLVERQVVPALRALLATDVDEQRQNPLALLRAAAASPTAVLRAAGVPPVERDPMAVSLQPDDVYDLAPAAFGDIHPDLHALGLTWGAAKAHVVLARRRREGRR